MKQCRQFLISFMLAETLQINGTEKLNKIFWSPLRKPVKLRFNWIKSKPFVLHWKYTFCYFCFNFKQKLFFFLLWLLHWPGLPARVRFSMVQEMAHIIIICFGFFPLSRYPTHFLTMRTLGTYVVHLSLSKRFFVYTSQKVNNRSLRAIKLLLPNPTKQLSIKTITLVVNSFLTLNIFHAFKC